MGREAERFEHAGTYHIYTDGSFRPPDNASCAYVVVQPAKKCIIKIESFPFRGMTINQMELMAIDKALDDPKMQHIVIYSDSDYSIKALTVWHKNWARNNWMTPLGAPVKNQEIIKRILVKIKTKKYFRMVKIKAHSGDPYNTLADFMAQNMSKRMMSVKDAIGVCVTQHGLNTLNENHAKLADLEPNRSR